MKEKDWVIRFRYIPPYDYMTPFLHIPIEETCVSAETADKAWEKFITSPFAGPRDNYRLVEIYSREKDNES